MSTTSRLFGCLAVVLSCLSVLLSQTTNPPPADPHEMVTRKPKILTSPADRSAAIDLLTRTRKNFDINEAHVPYVLKLSFQTNGATRVEGAGTMEEFYDGREQFRWTAQLGDMHITRIGADHHVYGTNASEPVPLRIQMVRNALFKAVQTEVAKFEIRSANVQHDGAQLTCFLLNYSLPSDPAPREWKDRESCVDPATGLLRISSNAPGLYALYDYDGGDFHGHVLPRQISIFEEGRLTLQIHLESLEDAPNLDANLFKPSPEMGEANETFGLSGPSHLSAMRVDPADAPTSRFYQPVFVHAILNAEDGKVLDAEALQDSSDELGRAAVDLVRNADFDPTGFQQEVFVSVHFHLPATRFGGPPITVFRSTRVRWVRVDMPRRTAPPPHHGK